MQVNRRTAAGNLVAAGSVWESRIRADQGNGGIKVFQNPQEEEEEEKGSNLKGSVGRNRRTWKLGAESDPTHLRKTRSELLKKLADDFSSDKTWKGDFRRAVMNNEFYDEDEDDEVADVEMEEIIDIKEVNSVEEKRNNIAEEKKIHQIHEVPISVSPMAEEKIKKPPISPFKPKSASNDNFYQTQPKLRKNHGNLISPSKQKTSKGSETPDEIHEISTSPLKRRSDDHKDKLDQIQEIPISPFKHKNGLDGEKHRAVYDIPEYAEKQRSLAEKQKLYRFDDMPTSPEVKKKLITSMDYPLVVSDLRKPHQNTVGAEEPPELVHESHIRLQSIVDLIMWRDMAKSAIVFCFGTFILFSSSLIKDFNYSFISTISYLCLFYLVSIFFYKSFCPRGAKEFEVGGHKHVVGEEEAICVLKSVLPYFNQLLISIRCLFSGEPATTVKVATFLFVLARCGNSITIWTLARLAFFGAFTFPKLFSAYSSQISVHGKFWVQRFRDAWDSCTHKKVVAAIMLIVMWNSFNTAARIWAAFVLLVVLRMLLPGIIFSAIYAE